jgi:hypothetical protein
MPWDDLKRLAFGPLCLKPWEFWKLTHGEFIDLIEGYNLRTEHEMTRIAVHAAWLINSQPGRKKKVTVKQLLGKDKTMSQENKQAEFDKLKRLLQKQRAE